MKYTFTRADIEVILKAINRQIWYLEKIGKFADAHKLQLTRNKFVTIFENYEVQNYNP